MAFLNKDSQKEKYNHILEIKGNSPCQELASRKRMKVGVEMEEFGAEQRPECQGVKIATREIPKGFRSPTG